MSRERFHHREIPTASPYLDRPRGKTHQRNHHLNLDQVREDFIGGRLTIEQYTALLIHETSDQPTLDALRGSYNDALTILAGMEPNSPAQQYAKG